ncbi:hypothetical protein NKI89_29115 [Mesorhizobium sp. M0309]|uniref:hypothetical protein n=1 Tax=Mesorhizobium sp. M0309 TaxID=2956933 RepID=UPI0033374A3E
MRRIRLTMLNFMAGSDLAAALDRHVQEGLEICHLKDGIFGKRLEELSHDQLRRLADEIAARGLKTYCLSTSLGVNSVILDRVVSAADILKPALIRVIVAKDTSLPQGGEDNMNRVLARYPWLAATYDELIARINAAGFDVVLENEAHDCIIKVICINPSHGTRAAGFDDWNVARDDLRFIRAANQRVA